MDGKALKKLDRTVSSPGTCKVVVNPGELVMSFGCELEWSDIDRRIDIPKELGSWEGPKMAGYYMGSEIDIVNTQGRWKGIATDPLCITCPVGGEIHTVPSILPESQLLRIMRIMELFPKLGVACPNHGHVHVGIPELKTNIDLLKNFFEWLESNENDLIRYCCGYTAEDHELICASSLPDWAKRYFLVGDGKHISPDVYAAVKNAETVEEVINILKDVSCFDWMPVTEECFETPGSHRTAVNMFNLTKGDTIEFRIFRASLNPIEIYSTLKFAEEVCRAACLGKAGAGVKEILTAHQFQFPKLNFDLDLATRWVDTRQTKGRCGPFKKSFSSATEIFEDPALQESYDNLTGFDQGLISILIICSNFYEGNTLEKLQEDYYSSPVGFTEDPKK